MTQNHYDDPWISPEEECVLDVLESHGVAEAVNDSVVAIVRALAIKCAKAESELEGSAAEINRLVATQVSPPGFFEKLAAAQVELPADCAKILREHLWELYDGEVSPPTPEPTRYACVECRAVFTHEPLVLTTGGIPAVTRFFCSAHCRDVWSRLTGSRASSVSDTEESLSSPPPEPGERT